MSFLSSKFGAVAGTVVARIAVVVTGLATSILTARALGPEGRGAYYAVVTLSAILAQFGNLGLSSSNTFLAARNPSFSTALTINSVWVSLATSGLAWIAVVVVGPLLASRLGVDRDLVWPVAVIGPAMLCFTLASSILVAREQWTALNSWQVANAVVAAALLALCAALSLQASQFLIATAIAALLSVAGILWQLLSKEKVAPRFDLSLFRAGFKYSARAYVALLLGFLLQRTAVTVLAMGASPREVGYFSIAAQIADVLAIVPTTIGMVLFPALLKRATGTWETTRQALVGTVALMTVICAVTAALGGFLIPWLFGADFAPSHRVLLYLLPGTLFLSVVTVLSQYLVTDGFPVRLLLTWCAGLALSVVLGITLVGTYASIGAAAAQSIGLGFVCVGLAWLSHSKAAAANLRGIQS